jgi:hypothetical protein
MKISPEWLKQNIYKKNQNCLAKNPNNLFCFRGFQYAFDEWDFPAKNVRYHEEKILGTSFLAISCENSVFDSKFTI